LLPITCTHLSVHSPFHRHVSLKSEGDGLLSLACRDIKCKRNQAVACSIICRAGDGVQQGKPLLSQEAFAGETYSFTPDEMRGRSTGIGNLLVRGSLPIGIALAGILIQNVGVVTTIFIISGCRVLIALGATLNAPAAVKAQVE